MRILHRLQILLSMVMVLLIVGTDLLYALGPAPAFNLPTRSTSLQAGSTSLLAAEHFRTKSERSAQGRASLTGRLLFAPAIDGDDKAETNPVQNVPVPVLDLIGETHGIVTLAAQLETDDARQVPMGVPVTFRLWNDRGFRVEEKLESDAWGAVAVDVPLDEVGGEFSYQAEAAGFGTTEVRLFRFDPGQYSYRVHADGAELAYQEADASTVFTLQAPRALDAGRDEVSLIVTRRPEVSTGAESPLQPVFAAVDDARLGLPFPTVAMQIVGADTAQVDLQLPPGEYSVVAMLASNGSPAEYFYSQAMHLSLAQETAAPSGEAVWVSELEYEPGQNLVQYRAPEGQARFGLVDAAQLPEVKEDWEGQNQMVKVSRTGPFEWREDTYDVQVETLVTDGKKVVALQDFDYDPILRRYTLAIRSQQAEVVTDTLRVDVLGPDGVVIYHEDTPIVLDPAETTHYIIEVPAELGQPYGLKVVLDDPFDGIVQNIAAAGRMLYNAARSAGGHASASVRFFAEIMGLTIAEYQFNAPGPDKGFRWFPDTSSTQVVWKVVKWMATTAWDVKNGRYTLGQAGVEVRVDLGVDFDVDPGKCPDPAGKAQVEARLKDLALDLDASLSTNKIDKSIYTPAVPIFWIVMIWGKGQAKLEGKADASGLKLKLVGRGQLSLALQVGLALPLADYATAISDLATIYKYAAALNAIAGVVRAAQSVKSWQVPQEDCEPDPPDPAPPDDRQDVWQGVEGFYAAENVDQTIDNLNRLIQQAQAQGLWRSERLLTLRLRDAELERFNSDTEQLAQHIEDFNDILIAGSIDVQGILSGTIPISPSLTITEALNARMEQTTAEMEALPYSRQQKRLMDDVAVAERLYLELEGQELDLQHELRQLLTTDAIGVVASGFAESTLAVLDAIDLPARLVSPWAGGTTFRKQKAPYYAPALAPRALVIPSGGLHAIASSPEARAWLEEYVQGGGLLIVFTQAFGADWRALPGGEVAGMGYEEDQRWQHATVEAGRPSKWLVWMGIEKPDIQVDGAFTAWPTNASLLLRRTAGKYAGSPVMIEYSFGAGTVLATSAYGDWAWQTNYWWGDEARMTHTLLQRAYLLTHGQDIEEVATGDPASTVDISFPLTNTGVTTATAVEVILPIRLGWWGSDYRATIPVSLAPGESQVIHTSLKTPPVMRGVHDWTQVGLYHLDVHLRAAGKELYSVPGPFVYVRSPVIPSSLGVEIQARPAWLFETAAITGTVENFSDDEQTVLLKGLFDLPSRPVTLTVAAHSSASYVYTLVADASKDLGVQITTLSGQFLGKATAQLKINFPRLQGKPVLPPALGDGALLGMEVVNRPRNQEMIGAALNGSFTMTLTSPSEVVVWSVEQALPPLAVGEAITPTFSLDLPALEFGTYLLSYRLDDGTGHGRTERVLLPARAAVSLAFDRKEYRIREPMTMTVHVANSGLFDLAPALELSAPDLGWSDALTVNVPAGDEWSGVYTFTLPTTLVAGSHTLTAHLNAGTSLAQTASFSILPASVSAQIGDPAYTAGGTLPLTLFNSGGVDAHVSYQQWLLSNDAHFLIGENTAGVTVPANTAVVVSGSLPAGMRSGPYTLYLNGTYLPGNETLRLTQTVEVAGTEIQLKARTHRPEYLTTDPITVTAWLTNTGTILPEGELGLTIRKPVASGWGWEQYYPYNSGLSFYWLSAVGTDVAGNVWLAGSSSDGYTSPGVDRLSADLSTWDHFNLPFENSWVTVNEIAGGADGRVWFATDNGVAVLSADGNDWTIYQNEAGELVSNWVYAVAVDADGDAWFGTDNGISRLTAGGEWISYTVDNSDLTSNWVYSIAPDHNGDVWIGTDYGLNRLTSGDSWITYTADTSGILNNYVYDIAIDAAGNVWLVNPYYMPAYAVDVQLAEEGNGGVSELHADGSWTVYTPYNSGLADTNLTAITIDRAGRKWIGYDGYCGEGEAADIAPQYSQFGGCGVSILSADDVAWEQYISPQLSSSRIQDLAAAPNGDVWMATSYGATRAYAFGGDDLILWTRTLTTSLDSPDTFQDISSLAADSLAEIGRLELHGVLTSTTGQVLAHDVYPFYVFPTEVGLTLESDREIYTPDQQMTITGRLINASGLPLNDQWIEVQMDGYGIYYDGPINLGVGESYPYTITTYAPVGERDVILNAWASDAGMVEHIITVAAPKGDAQLIVPPFAGSDPFRVTLVLTNTAVVPASLEVNFSGGIGSGHTEMVTLPAGQTEIVTWNAAIEADTDIVAQVWGDWNVTLSAPVAWGEGATLELLPAEADTAGLVPVSYRLTGTGALPTAVTLEYFVDDGDVSSLEATLLPGQVTLGTLWVDVSEGLHTLTAELYSSNDQLISQDELVLDLAQAGIPASPDLRLVGVSLNPVPVAAGDTLAVSVEVANFGAAGAGVVGLQLFDPERQWAVQASGWTTHTFVFGVEVPADLPADRYFGEVTLDGQRQAIVVDVTGIDVDLSLALDQPEYIPGEAGHLTVSLTDQAGVTGDYVVMSRYLGDESYVTVTVPANQTIQTTFDFTATESSRATVFLSNVAGPEGQRVLMLDSLPVQVVQRGQGAYLTFDKLVYDPGDTIGITAIITGEIGSLAVMGPMEFALLGDDFLFWQAPRHQDDQGLVITGSYPLSYQLPSELRAGRYTFLLQIDGQMYPYTVDVRGWKVTTRHITLDKGRYAQSDHLSATVEFWNQGDTPLTGLRLTAWIFTPNEDVLELSPLVSQTVNLQPGLNVVSLSGAFTTPDVGQHRLLVNLGLPDSGWRIAGAMAQFDVGWSHLVELTTDQGNYLPGENGEGRLDLYGFGPTQVVVTATGGTTLLDQSVDLSGFETLTFALPTVSAGDYLLVATSQDQVGGSDRLVRAYNVTEPRDTLAPDLQLTYPNTSTLIVTSALTQTLLVTGQASDNSGTVRVFVNGQEATLDGSGTFSLAVEVRQGVNLISALAVDEDANYAFSDQIPVTLMPVHHTSLAANGSEVEVGQPLWFTAVVTASATISDVTLVGRATGSAVSAPVVTASGGTVTSSGERLNWFGNVEAGQALTVTIGMTPQEVGVVTYTVDVLWGYGEIESRSQQVVVRAIPPTQTPTPTATNTPLPTNTPTPTATATFTPTPTQGTPAACTQVVIQRGTQGTVADAYIWSANPATNYNTQTLSTGFLTDIRKRTLVRFDLNSVLPPNAVVQWAVLGVFQYTSTNGSAINGHRITAAWDESSVTWNSFADAYDSSVIGSWQPGQTGWRSMDITSLVRSWANGSLPNYGLLLDQPASTGSAGYYSSEYTTNARRPQLVICYTGSR